MGLERAQGAIAIPNTLVAYHSELFRRSLAQAFENNQVECRISAHDDKSPISIVGSADRVVMFEIFEGDNWEQSFARINVLADAFSANNSTIQPNTQELGVYFIDLEGRRDRLDEKIESDSTRRAVVKGQGIPIRALARSMAANGVSFVCDLNGHSHRIHDMFMDAGIFHIPLSTERVLADRLISDGILTKESIHSIVLGTTDVGGLKEITTLKRYLDAVYETDTPIAVINKYHVPTGVDFITRKVSEFVHGDVKDKFVIVIDDRTDSVESISQAVDIYLEQGAAKVGIYVTHPVFGVGKYYNTCKTLLGNPRVEFLFVSNSLPMESERTSRPGGLNIPHVMVDGADKVMQILDIHPYIVQTTKTILSSLTLADAYTELDHAYALLDMRDPFEIFEDLSGLSLPRPQIIGYYDDGLIYQFDS